MTTARKRVAALAACAFVGVALWALHAWAAGAQGMPELVIDWGDRNWIPAGGKDEKTPGNWVLIHASLVAPGQAGSGYGFGGMPFPGSSPDGKTPEAGPPLRPPGYNQARARRFIFELVDVSREPGVCMNWPAKRSGEPDYDLKFNVQKNEGVGPRLTISRKGLRAETAEGDYEAADVYVSAYDYGAYGKLRITAELTSGGTLVKEELLPRRPPGSRIAYGWTTGWAEGRPSPDDSDDDAKPEGDGHKGEGLTHYEEYRGFMVDGVYTRLEPEAKDFFVCDLIYNATSEGGIRLFEHLSGLKVHGLKLNELDEHGRVNFNFSAGHAAEKLHRADVYGVALATRDNFGGMPTVRVDRSISSFDDPSRAPPASRPDWVDLEAFIARGLLHKCHVADHGPPAKKVEWSYDPDAPNGTLTEWTRDARGKVRSQTIRVVFTEGEDYSHALSLFKRFPDRHMHVWLASQGGDHGGEQRCIMRQTYADARIPSPPTDERMVLDFKDGCPPGLAPVEFYTLCDSPKANLRDFPKPYVFGDAALGDCKHQLCVNESADHAAMDQKKTKLLYGPAGP